MVPKQRYAIMKEYLPTRGGMALDMMLRTATVQANYDYLSEADAMVKMRVALKLAPLTTALFANSPFVEGKPFGGKSYRAKVWLDTDNDRSGLVPGVWKKDASFKDYVEWALDVPMFMFKRDGEKVVNTGQTFRSFWKSGFQGHRATDDGLAARTTATRSSPRCASRRRSKCAAPTRRGPTWPARCRPSGPASSTTTRRSPRRTR